MQTSGSFSLRQFLGSRTGLVLLGFLGVAGFYVITEHTAHLFGILPYALLLLCPLLHFFLHGRHGDHKQHADQQPHAQGGQQ
jgi:hypothetical protein